AARALRPLYLSEVNWKRNANQRRSASFLHPFPAKSFVEIHIMEMKKPLFSTNFFVFNKNRKVIIDKNKIIT
ncbi:hypothetical protein, partial [uncultured Oscillibacter sp.]|uniref:hypothetical protein n=1 Tax=uncultured Oscillibacter sp. TaxID=876091 RepID=UPI0025D889D0